MLTDTNFVMLLFVASVYCMVQWIRAFRQMMGDPELEGLGVPVPEIVKIIYVVVFPVLDPICRFIRFTAGG